MPASSSRRRSTKARSRRCVTTLPNRLSAQVIAGDIEVKTVDLGTVPPELEILEIGDLTTDRFRGIFRLTYAGDAFIELQTSVQV